MEEAAFLTSGPSRGPSRLKFALPLKSAKSILSRRPDVFHIQLIADHVAQRLDRSVLPDRGRPHVSAQRLAHFQVVIGPELAAKTDGGHDIVHLRFEFDIAPAAVAEGKVAEMYGLGQVRRPRFR